MGTQICRFLHSISLLRVMVPYLLVVSSGLSFSVYFLSDPCGAAEREYPQLLFLKALTPGSRTLRFTHPNGPRLRGLYNVLLGASLLRLTRHLWHQVAWVFYHLPRHLCRLLYWTLAWLAPYYEWLPPRSAFFACPLPAFPMVFISYLLLTPSTAPLRCGSGTLPTHWTT